jgi:uncharacterized protein YecT (DUF1311 family)
MISPKTALAFVLTVASTGAFAAADTDLASANAALNAQYALVRNAQQSANDKSELRAVELAWISYKDKECAFESGTHVQPKPGTSHWPLWSDCEVRLTRARTDELAHLVCPGLGVSVCNPH